MRQTGSLPSLPGTAGELLIGGVQVALGYIGAEDLTRERFGCWAGTRTYRTGDLVRLMPLEPWGTWSDDFTSDVVLEFLGRIDFQVKLRGHRVELGEIEEVARSFVRDAVALVVSNHVGEQLLALFLTPEDVDLEDLRQRLQGRLAAYMVPDLILPRASLPLSSSGKVDRKVLAASVELSAQPRGQVTPEESIILDAFQEVLGIQLAPEDDFFKPLAAETP